MRRLAVAVAVLGCAGAANAQAATNNIFTVAGTTAGFAGDGGPAPSAQLNFPGDVAITADGGYLIADNTNNRVRRVAPNGTITTVAGTGNAAFSGDGGPATAAELKAPRAVAVMPDGGFLIADGGNARVRRVSPAGTITTVAGTGTTGSSGDGGPATAAPIPVPVSVSVTAEGGFLVADPVNQRIRMVSPGGTITTVAGTGSTGGSGDGGPATAAALDNPRAVTATPGGGFLIGDVGNHRVRRVSPDGTITTAAGDGVSAGPEGDGGPATLAHIDRPNAMAVTPDGGFVFSDFDAQRVRRVSPRGIITTVAGAGTPGLSGDGGAATAAQLNDPLGIAVTAEGGLLLADSANSRIRFIDVDLRGPAAGPPGPAGDTGPQGLPGPTGPTGPAVTRDLLAFALAGDPLKARAKRAVPVRFASTLAASVRFDVLKAGRRVGRRSLRAKAGRNSGRLRVALAPGRYVLAARAVAGDQVATDRVKLVVRR